MIGGENMNKLLCVPRLAWFVAATTVLVTSLLFMAYLRISTDDISPDNIFIDLNVPPDTLIDSRDGKGYRIVNIGSRIWMAENLNFEMENSWCYDDKDSNCLKYGRLYDWNTAMEVCPMGWRLPNSEDWKDLLLNITDGYCNFAKYLKSTIGWTRDGNGIDSFGFSALPGGIRRRGNDFFDIGDAGNWWGMKDNYPSSTLAVYMLSSNTRVFMNSYFSKNDGLSVRCISTSLLPVASTDKAVTGNKQAEITNFQEIVTDTLVDLRDGKKYRTVKIGNKIWMAENLNFEAENSQCYDDKDSNCQKYGRLYNWDAAMKICPAGWRLPDTADWNNLARAAGGQYNYPEIEFLSTYWTVADKTLKSTTGWNDGGNGTNQFGFSALPGGEYNPSRAFGTERGLYNGIGSNGYWYTATENSNDFSWYWVIGKCRHAWMAITHKSTAASVRCIQKQPVKSP
jgi:uncharacterized protein (TIGR02145 family)